MAADIISFYNNKDPEHDTFATDPHLDVYDQYSSAPTPEHCVLNCAGWTIPSGKVFKEWNSMRNGSGFSLNPGEPIELIYNYFAIWEDEPAPVEYITTGAELTSIADAIRTKGSTSSPLSYPEGFISAINDISGGGDAFADAIIMRTISGEYTNSACSVVGEYAFYTCSSLTTVNFPVCTSIGSSAFYSCSSLTTASFPVCTTIGSNAFCSCSSLTTVSFPVCTTIGSYAFKTCSSLTIANFPSCISIESYAFYYCTSLTTASFPSCTSIAERAFYTCSSLTTVSFPVCISIGVNAFRTCSSLTIANFPSCISIESYAFCSCRGLTAISFPVCTTIGLSAFCSCSSLTTASFPECSFIRAAFGYCTKLMSVYFMSTSVVTMSAGTAAASRAFYNTPMENSTYTGEFGSIYVPASLVDAYKSASGWSFYSSRITGI